MDSAVVAEDIEAGGECVNRLIVSFELYGAAIQKHNFGREGGDSSGNRESEQLKRSGYLKRDNYAAVFRSSKQSVSESCFESRGIN